MKRMHKGKVLPARPRISFRLYFLLRLYTKFFFANFILVPVDPV